MKASFLVLFLSIASPSLFAQFTFDTSHICSEAKKLNKNVDSNTFKFLLDQVIPTLNYFSINGEVSNYVEICECTNIHELIYNFKFYPDNETNMLKLEAKFDFERVHLQFTRTHKPDLWVDFFIKRISSDMTLIMVAEKTAKYLPPNQSAGNPDRVVNLKNEFIEALIGDIKYASENCDVFTKDQIKTYNEYISQLAEAKPLLHIYTCK